jgi:hypothetical protein
MRSYPENAEAAAAALEEREEGGAAGALADLWCKARACGGRKKGE